MTSISTRESPGTHAADKQDVLVLIAQDVDADDRRNAMQITGIPPLGTLVLFRSRDHRNNSCRLPNIEGGAIRDRNL